MTQARCKFILAILMMPTRPLERFPKEAPNRFLGSLNGVLYSPVIVTSPVLFNNAVLGTYMENQVSTLSFKLRLVDSRLNFQSGITQPFSTLRKLLLLIGVKIRKIFFAFKYQNSPRQRTFPSNFFDKIEYSRIYFSKIGLRLS